MKKRILSILLVIALALSMIACVNSQETASDTQTTSKAQSTTSVEKIIGTVDEQLPTVPRHECKLEFLNNCEDEKDSPILKMTSEEISDYIAEMVHISQTEDLCWSCMLRIGSNFRDIWRLNSSACDKTEFEAQAIVAFDNVLAQAEAKQIPFDEFDSWQYLPIKEILCKYYSSSNFAHPDFMGFSPVAELSSEDLIEVANVFFSNPVFEINYFFARSILKECSDNEQASNMAWEHLIALSNSSLEELYRESDTYFTCHDILGRTELLSDARATTIAENILQNPHYNFVAKYLFMCSDFDHESNLDTPICDMAFEHLLDVTQNADEETYSQVVETTVKLYDKYNLATDEVEALYGNYDIDALVSYLQSWKEISKTEMPRYY